MSLHLRVIYSIGNRRFIYSIGFSSKVSNLWINIIVRWRDEEHFKIESNKKSDCLEAAKERLENNEMPLFIHFIISCNNAGTLNFISFSWTIGHFSLSPLLRTQHDMAFLIFYPNGISCSFISPTPQILLHQHHYRTQMDRIPHKYPFLIIIFISHTLHLFPHQRVDCWWTKIPHLKRL